MTKIINYTEVIIKFHRSALPQMDELKKHALTKFFCSGVEEFIIDEAEVDRILGERSYSGGDIPLEVLEEVESIHHQAEEISFKFYFEGEEDEVRERNVEAFLEFSKKELKEKLIHIESSTNKQQDWNSVWREHYETIVISPSLKVIPSWEKKDLEKGNIKSDELYIYPGQGFGTGGHETTHLCLEYLCELKGTNKSCLDFGCGSGILGIGAYKKGIRDIVMYDIDEEALKNTLQNCELNEMEPVELLHSSQRKILEKRIEEKKFDLVFANILMNVLELECDFLIHSLEKGGHLILSGLLHHQGELIKARYSQSMELEFISEKRKNDWLAIYFRKK